MKRRSGAGPTAGSGSSVFTTRVAIMHHSVGADLLIGPSERGPALRVGQEADPYKPGCGPKNGAPVAGSSLLDILTGQA